MTVSSSFVVAYCYLYLMGHLKSRMLITSIIIIIIIIIIKNEKIRVNYARTLQGHFT